MSEVDFKCKIGQVRSALKCCVQAHVERNEVRQTAKDREMERERESKGYGVRDKRQEDWASLYAAKR